VATWAKRVTACLLRYRPIANNGSHQSIFGVKFGDLWAIDKGMWSGEKPGNPAKLKPSVEAVTSEVDTSSGLEGIDWSLRIVSDCSACVSTLGVGTIVWTSFVPVPTRKHPSNVLARVDAII
jgi:hypothetical protein